MSSPFKQFSTSSELETLGVWLNFGDFHIKVARAGGSNKRYGKASDLYFEPHRRAAEVGALSEKDASEALANVYADSVILGWRTVNEDGSFRDTIDGPDGEPWQFTRENVVKLLTLLPDFFGVLRKHCENFQNFKRSSLERDAGN